MKDSLRTCAHEHAEYLTRLCQEMIRLPSLSGSETVMAALVERAMRDLDYDVVEADEVGNVVGTLSGERPALMLTAHMDVVDPARTTMPWPWSGCSRVACGGAVLSTIRPAWRP